MYIVNHNDYSLDFKCNSKTVHLLAGQKYFFNAFRTGNEEIIDMVRKGMVTILDEDDNLDDIENDLEENIENSKFYKPDKSVFSNVKFKNKDID